MTKLDLLYIQSGGGHRSAALALQEAIRMQRRPWQTRLVCLDDVLGPIDPVRRTAGLPAGEIYNLMLKKGWTLGTAQFIAATHAFIRLLHPAQVKLLARYWSESRPDLVVSLIPHYNRAIAESLDASRPGTPLVTVLTDLADYPPHFWIERQRQYYICGSERAMEQARQLGGPLATVMRVSGMIVHPRFYSPRPLDRRAERARLGLQPELPTGVVMFGGEGSAEIPRIAQRIEKARLKTQLILLCGRHAGLTKQLRARKWKIPVHIAGFTRDVPHFMQLGDYFIGKPGPGSISEALAMRLPVIVALNAWTLAQERYNADWIAERRVGLVLKSYNDIDRGVEALLSPESYRQYRERAGAVANRAVFEIPDLLAGILRCREPELNPPGLQPPHWFPAEPDTPGRRAIR